jgi:hypothetical protein
MNKVRQFLPLIVIAVLILGFLVFPPIYDSYLRPRPVVAIGSVVGSVEREFSLTPYLTLKIRSPDGGITYESSQPSHSPTRHLANLLAQHLGAEYLMAGDPYKFNIHYGAQVSFPYTQTATPPYSSAYFIDNGLFQTGAALFYGLTTLYIIAGKSPYASFNPDVSWLPAAAGYRFEQGAVTVSMGGNATHAWVTLSTSISVSTNLVVEDVGIILHMGQSSTQFCGYQRSVGGGCPTWPVASPPLVTLVWWDKVTAVTVPAGSTLDVGYTFYAAFPAGGNFLSVIFSLLHQPRASEGYIIYDTASVAYTNYFPEFHAAYASPSTYYLWPALRLQWGTGSASLGPWSPVRLVNKIGEGDAILTVSSLPTGGVVLTLTGIATNPTSSDITITEVGFQLGGVSGVGALCLRNAGNTATACPAPDKAVLIAYLPTSITLRPGEAVQIVFKVSFTSI